MLTISKPLSASQARTYHAKEFASQQQNYWSRNQRGHSEWQGRLRRQWNLHGPVQDEHFARLAEGQHPRTGEHLVRHQVSRTYEGKNGKEVTSVEHRAGWDATFSAPKSVSITALVGGDDRVRLAHRESVRAALAELERYTQARIGNVHAPETTGKLAAATFEHDTARPVDGYAAPQLHTHAVIFNVTERDNGQTRALQPHEIFVSQRYVTAVYRSELALRLEKLGYETRTRQARPARNQGIHKRVSGSVQPAPGTDQRPSARARDRWSRGGADRRASHARPQGTALAGRSLAAAPGAGRAVWEPGGSSGRSGPSTRATPDARTRDGAQRAVTWARDHVFERSAVHDRRAILESALARGMGETSSCQHPAGVRSPRSDGRIPRSCPERRRPAVHDHRA